MSETHPEVAEARPHRRRFSLIWLIPIAAALVTAYLAYSTFSTRGPLIVVTFTTADGLAAGQTQVRYRSVTVGTVEKIELNGALTGITTHIRMNRAIQERLTAQARFWVVRPRLTAGNISGLETIVSGAYIEFDPGPAGEETQSSFAGLADAPGIRSDEPGRIFTLRTWTLGSISPGSPVFFRDVVVGEVLSYETPKLDGILTVRAFIREPFSGYVRDGSRFWNTSGIGLGFGPQGLKVELQSLRALFAGGIAFDTPPRLRDQPAAAADAQFTLYDDVETALTATSEEGQELLVYLEGSVRGLARQSAVEMRGIRVGSVRSVDLEYDRESDRFRVPVRIAIEPDRIAFPAGRPAVELRAALEGFVARGLRAKLLSGNLLTGQKVIGLDFYPDAPPASVTMAGETIVLPSIGGDGDDIMAAVSALAGKLERFPLDDIGRNLNTALASVAGLAGGPELRGAIGGLAGVMAQVQDLVRSANANLTPALRRLPGIANNLDQAVARANTAIGSVERGYGGDSSFSRDLTRLLQQSTDATRSIRLLADFLARHPEALLRGRTE